MKYGSLTLGQIEALVNKVGGIPGVKKVLNGDTQELSIEISTESKSEKEPVIRTEWYQGSVEGVVFKEVLGGRSFFRWCHGRMRRVWTYRKESSGTVSLNPGFRQLYCEVCGNRIVDGGGIYI